MNYIEFHKLLSGFTVFSLADIRQADSAFDRRRLNEWQAKSYIQKVIKGYYVFADLAKEEKALFEIANRIYSPSYVSLEMALAYYGLIPESAYGVTSVATRRTMDFHTTLGTFIYRTVRPELYFGFEYLPFQGSHCKIASPEKALLDYIYLHPGLGDRESFAALRLDRKELLKTVDRGKMEAYRNAFGQKSFRERVALFWEYMEHA